MSVMELLFQFVAFTMVDGLICYLFFVKVRRHTVDLLTYFILCVGNYIIWFIFPPVYRQILNTLWMAAVLIATQTMNPDKYKYKYCIMSSVSAMVYVLVTEMAYDAMLELLNVASLLTMDDLVKLFLYLIPIKIVQIIVIMKWGDNMSKLWTGEIVRK